MKRYRIGWTFSCVILMLTQGCFRPSQAWNGTWKLEQSKSSIPGPNFLISVTSSGEYHYDNGGRGYSFRCDGKEYPTEANRTTSCAQKSTLVIDRVGKEDGAEIGISHWELSTDGNQLTIKSTTSVPQGVGLTKMNERVYQRTSGSAGFAGGWRDLKRLESIPQIMRLTINGRILHMETPEAGQYADLPLDGSDAPLHGPGVPAGETRAMTAHGSNEFVSLTKSQGNVLQQGSLTISADGRTIVEQYWRPNLPNERAVLTFEKQ